MKTNILKLNLIVLFISLMGAGCEKNDMLQSGLEGKWILSGF
jgi:hypothetical protein